MVSPQAVRYSSRALRMVELIDAKMGRLALPSVPPELQWISCSERLPETDKARSYWICTDGGYQCQCRWSNDMYGLGANEYSEWGWHIMDKPQYARVIAWMPLPEPYTERREE